MSPSEDAARQLRVQYQAWLGLGLLEDFAEQVCRLTGCPQEAEVAVWFDRLEAMVDAYAERTGLSPAEAWIELETSTTAGVASVLPSCMGRRGVGGGEDE